MPYKSVQVDVTGKPRRTKVRLPSSILSSKPRSVPNHQVDKGTRASASSGLYVMNA